MISKELLEAVLGYPISNTNPYRSNNYIIFRVHSIRQKINIYELAHKCKEWAYKEGHPVTTFMANNITHFRCSKEDYEKRVYEKRVYGEEANEIDGVFEICQWILDNKER